MSDLLPSIVYGDTIRDMQARLMAAAKGTDDSVRVCSGIDTGTRAAWGLFYIQVTDFVARGPNFLLGWGGQADRAQELERELYTWQTKLSSSCHLDVPLFNPAPPGPADAWVSIVQYAAVAAMVVGGAYAVGRIVEVLPKPIVRGSR
jgi:hypothetical protein